MATPTTLYYVDGTGKYLGAFVDGAQPPAGAIAVPSAPAHGAMIWQNGAWATPASLAAQLAAQAAINAGCAIVSASTPALNGTYAIDPVSVQNITAIATGIAARNRLPGGGSTFNYNDATGDPHAFNQTNFLNFAAAIEDYVYAVENGQTPALPINIA